MSQPKQLAFDFGRDRLQGTRDIPQLVRAFESRGVRFWLEPDQPGSRFVGHLMVRIPRGLCAESPDEVAWLDRMLEGHYPEFADFIAERALKADPKPKQRRERELRRRIGSARELVDLVEGNGGPRDLVRKARLAERRAAAELLRRWQPALEERVQ